MGRKTLFLVAALVALFAMARVLVLDTDEQDLQFAARTVNADQFNLPRPGSAYAYDQRARAFNPTKICSLHNAAAAEVSDDKLFSGQNHWGAGFNTALETMDEVVSSKLFDKLKIDEASRRWMFVSYFRESEVSVPLDVDCLMAAQQMASDPNMTVFIVDTVFEPKDPVDPKMVRFKEIPVQSQDCAPDCPGNVRMSAVLRAGWLVHTKRRWDIVTVH